MKQLMILFTLQLGIIELLSIEMDSSHKDIAAPLTIPTFNK